MLQVEVRFDLASLKISRLASQDTNQSYDIAALDEELQMVQDENMMLRNEIQVLKTRNTQLIENLRDKSMLLSKTQHKIEVQVSLVYLFCA